MQKEFIIEVIMCISQICTRDLLNFEDAMQLFDEMSSRDL